MMPTVDNVLILIDVWERLVSDLEVEKKNNICDFLQQIKGSDQWMVYYWSGHDSTVTDKKVSHAISQCNHLYTNDGLIVYNNTHKHLNYYFAGFHTNYCVFSNHIGIDKMLETTVESNRDFFIVKELTSGYDDQSRPTEATEILFKNVAWQNSSPHYGDLIWNYRAQIIRNNLISVNQIKV